MRLAMSPTRNDNESSAWRSRYRSIRILGTGGVGQVILAHDPHLDRLVAIKQLHEHIGDHTELLNEARALARCNHPNIVGVYEVSDDPASPYMVLEYVAGRTLRERLQGQERLKALGEAEALEIAAEIAAALEYAHARGIVHLDLKPENIILGPEGAKVLDFGMASRRGESSPSSPGGTLAYMSPEQLARRTTSARTDIWAFGVLLLECLTGAHPSSDLGLRKYVQKNLASDPIDVSAIHRPDLRHLVERCLQIDPKARFADGGDSTPRCERCPESRHLRRRPAPDRRP